MNEGYQLSVVGKVCIFLHAGPCTNAYNKNDKSVTINSVTHKKTNKGVGCCEMYSLLSCPIRSLHLLLLWSMMSKADGNVLDIINCCP